MTQLEWMKTFGDNLRDILLEKGMSQKQLSKDSGISTGMISDYINGKSVPGIIAIINMAYALDIDVGEFIDFDDKIIL